MARARSLPDEDLEEEIIEHLTAARTLMIERYRRGEEQRTRERRGFTTPR